MPCGSLAGHAGTGSVTRLAVCLAGIAGLIASPVSWSHHFVWIVPLAVSLVERARRGRRKCSTVAELLPRPGLVFVGWVIRRPSGRLPNGADVELAWTWSQNLLASVTAILGVALIISAIVVAQNHRLSRRRPLESSALRS